MQEDENELRRQRNNAAVRKSREKAKKHMIELETTIESMTIDNAKLERDAETLRKEVKVIRALYSAHIRTGHGLSLAEQDLVCPDDDVAVAALAQLGLSQSSSSPPPVHTLSS